MRGTEDKVKKVKSVTVSRTWLNPEGIRKDGKKITKICPCEAVCSSFVKA